MAPVLAAATTPGVGFWPRGHQTWQLQPAPSRGSWDTPCVGFPPTISSPGLCPCTGPWGAEPWHEPLLPSSPPAVPPIPSNPSPRLTQASGFGVGIRTLRRTRVLITRGCGSVLLPVLLQPEGRGGLRGGGAGVHRRAQPAKDPWRWRHGALSCARAWGQWSHGRNAPLSPTPAPRHLPWVPQELPAPPTQWELFFWGRAPRPTILHGSPCLPPLGPVSPCHHVTLFPYTPSP